MMIDENIFKKCQDKELQATIVCTADSSHYLIGGEDEQGNFFHLSYRGEEAYMTNSLELAKNLLRDNNIHEAVLEMSTPYDEMIGLSSPSVTREFISF